MNVTRIDVTTASSPSNHRTATVTKSISLFKDHAYVTLLYVCAFGIEVYLCYNDLSLFQLPNIEALFHLFLA